MALSGFEIGVGGITSIPVLAGLMFLLYKGWGEKNLEVKKAKVRTASSAKPETKTTKAATITNTEAKTAKPTIPADAELKTTMPTAKNPVSKESQPAK